jgi:tetratricopeptide (TPR) repeat protein
MNSAAKAKDFLERLNVRESFLLLFMAFVTLGLYYPATLGPFCFWDDRIETIAGLNHGQWSYAKELFFAHAGTTYRRPLSALAFLVTAKTFGVQPEPLHLLNVLVHLGSGMLVYLIAKRLSGRGRSGVWVGFTAALIFLVHPVNVEAVAWISARPTVLATFFILVSFCCHIFAKRGLRDWRLWGGALSYLLSLLSYEMAAAMPLAFMYWDLEQEDRAWRTALKDRWRRWMPYGLVLAVYLGYRQVTGGRLTLGASTPGPLLVFDTYLDHLSSPFVALGFYVKKLFWPWPLDYHILQVARRPYLALGIAFALLVIWVMWKKRTWSRFWLFWFICGLLMVLPLSFLRYSWTPVAERYLYLSSVAFSVSASIFVFQVLATRRGWVAQAAPAAVLVLLFVFGTGTTLRAKTWQTNLALAKDTFAQNPDNGTVEFGYGCALSEVGRSEEAVAHWKRAIRLGYVSEPARILASRAEGEKKYAEAEKYYLMALWPVKMGTMTSARPVGELGLLGPRDPEIYLCLARLHRSMALAEPEREKYHHERIVHFHEAACREAPDDVYLKYLLAKAQLKYGDPATARKLSAQVRDLAPDTYYGKAAAKMAESGNK